MLVFGSGTVDSVRTLYLWIVLVYGRTSELGLRSRVQPEALNIYKAACIVIIS